MESDEELLVRVRRHHEAALNELVVRYYARLGEFSFSLVRQRDLAEEAVLNVFLNVWRRRETIVINGVVRSYLFAAVGNQSLNLRKRHLRHDTLGLEEVPASQMIDTKRTESDLLYNELQAEVNALLMSLPPRRQLIFRMKRIEGFRYAEIAAALGLSERTVQNHMVEAVKQLAEGLARLRRTLHRDSLHHS